HNSCSASRFGAGGVSASTGIPRPTQSAITMGIESQETAATMKSGLSAASASSSVAQVGASHSFLMFSRASGLRATTPVRRKCSGNNCDGLMKKGDLQPAPTRRYEYEALGDFMLEP